MTDTTLNTGPIITPDTAPLVTPDTAPLHGEDYYNTTEANTGRPITDDPASVSGIDIPDAPTTVNLHVYYTNGTSVRYEFADDDAANEWADSLTEVQQGQITNLERV